jgi:DNA repair protein RadC
LLADKNTLQSGHRQRLRSRFVKAGPRSLPDYEILEMILCNAIPRADTKNLAKELLRTFNSLNGVLNAEPLELRKIDGVGDAIVFQLKLLNDLFSRLLIPTEGNFQVLNSWSSVINYCNLSIGYKKIEYFRVLYLNKKNNLIADEISQIGTIDRVQVYPREIAKRALENNAASIILVHNHPSGDIKPSREDIEITKHIIKALEPLSISVHDHLIIASGKHFSFKANNIM